MCNCISGIEKELKEKSYQDATIGGTAFIVEGDKLVLRTVQDCKFKDGVTKSGKDRIKNTPIKHDYCPFCGEKY